jgi:hypothetical protein
MIKFLLRKTFLHCWDNLYKLLCVNLCLALLVALYVYLASLRGGGYPGILIIYLFNLLIGTTSVVASRISDYELPEVSLFVLAAKTVWKDALFFSACFELHGMVLGYVIPFYLTLGNRLAGLLLAMLLFWVCVTWWLAMIYYYPVRLRLNLPVLTAARKAFLLFTDNLSLSFAIFLLSAVSLMLSLVTSMLLPGISLMLVFHQVAGRTLLLKYRYLESHPRAKRDIPWSLLLKDDLEVIGGRPLKGIIFPWKE